MIIGFDGSRAFVENRTGTENYSYQLLLNLAEIDTQNEYFVYIRYGFKVDPPIDKWPKNFQFKIINYPKLWTQFGLAIKTFKDPIDILFVPAHTLPLIRRANLKTVMTVHDLGVEYLPSLHQVKQRIYLNFITKFQLKFATKLIAVSWATKKDLIKKVGISPENIEVIYEGVNREEFKPIGNDILISKLKHFDIKFQRYFLFLGTIQPRKNLERLIRAFAKLESNYQLVLAGVKGWLSDDIYELPKKLGIEYKVKWLGKVENDCLTTLYSGAIALVFPSLFEGFGLPILEAFSCHCPVITSNISSMPEVAGDAAIYVNPYDIDSIKKGMRKSINQQTRNKLIKEGLKQVNRFSWKTTAELTLKLFQNL